MSYRFIREYSQIIASGAVSLFAASCVFYKIYEGSFKRNSYEFKTNRNQYLGLSKNEEEAAKKFLYRTNNPSKFEFFRTNSMDYLSYGFNNIRQGCMIGLPASYFAKSKQDLNEFSPPNGFRNHFGQYLTYRDIEQKLGPDGLYDFKENLLLSDDAKLFGLGLAVAKTNNIFLSAAPNFTDLIGFSLAYFISFRRSRMNRLQWAQRRNLYTITTLLALSVSLLSRMFFEPILERKLNIEACNFGLDCCEGAEEYYEKMLNRNKIIRHVIKDGTYLIDEDGNFTKKPLWIPIFDIILYKNHFGTKLTERKQLCKKELVNMVIKLSKENEEKEKEKEVVKDEKNAQKIQVKDKELPIFRDIRLKLESITRK